MMTDACSSVCERSNFDNCVVLLIDSYVVHMYCFMYLFRQERNTYCGWSGGRSLHASILTYIGRKSNYCARRVAEKPCIILYFIDIEALALLSILTCLCHIQLHPNNWSCPYPLTSTIKYPQIQRTWKAINHL